MTDNVVRKKNWPFLNIGETKILHLHMIGIFTCRKYISNSPWTKQTHLAKSSELELHTWTLVIDGTLRDTADFVSALVNVYNFEISELLVFIVIVSLYLLVPENRLWWRRTFRESCKIMETCIGEILLQ